MSWQLGTRSATGWIYDNLFLAVDALAILFFTRAMITHLPMLQKAAKRLRLHRWKRSLIVCMCFD